MLLKKKYRSKKTYRNFSVLAKKTLSKQQKKAQDNDKIHGEK